MVLFFTRTDLKEEFKTLPISEIKGKHLDDAAATILSFSRGHKPETLAYFVEPEVFPGQLVPQYPIDLD
jgi:hypothetical protein